MKRKNKPTRRKPPRRPVEHPYFNTYEDYLPPWTVYLAGIGIALGIVGLSFLLGFGRTQGWW